MALNKSFSNIFLKQTFTDKVYSDTMLTLFKKTGYIKSPNFYKKNNFISFANLHKKLQFFNFSGSDYFEISHKPNVKLLLSNVNANRLQDNFYYTHNALKASHVIGDDFEPI